MPDPKTESQTGEVTPPSGDPLIGLSARWRGGLLDANAWRLTPSSYRLDLDNRFDERNRFGTHLDLSTDNGLAIDHYGLSGRFGFGQSAVFNADFLHSRDGQVYGADGAFKLGKDGNGTAAFRIDEPAGTSTFNTKLKFDEFSHLNADWQRTRDGQVYGADGAFKLGKDGNGTAAFRVDEPAGTSMFNTKLKFDEFSHLNADWQRTRDGQVYGADGAFKLGKDGNGTAAFRVDEPAGTSMFNTKLKFDEFSHLNADWQRTRDGQNYGADGAFKLGKDGNGTAAFRVDEPAGTSMFNTKLRFAEGYGLNADYTGTRLGAIYGADTEFKLGKEGQGTGAFRVDEPAGTSSMNARLRLGNGDNFKFDLEKGRAGAVIDAEGAFGFAKDARARFGVRIDQPAGRAEYRLGTEFANGDRLRAALGTGPQGTSLNLGANVGFAKDAGSLALDGTFGPKLDFGAAVDYRNPQMALGGKIRFDNSQGPVRVSEFGATFRTVDNPRHQFSLEAGYRPEARDAFVKVGWTFTFGGGSRPSKPIESAPEPSLPYMPATSVVEPRTALSPNDRALHDAALSGVRRLNAGGVGLPVDETAASLAALAKQQGLRGIGYVEMGGLTATGQQNLFIGEGDPGDPAGRRAFMDRSQAAATPVQESLSKLASQGGNEALDVSTQQKRVAMP